MTPQQASEKKKKPGLTETPHLLKSKQKKNHLPDAKEEKRKKKAKPTGTAPPRASHLISSSSITAPHSYQRMYWWQLRPPERKREKVREELCGPDVGITILIQCRYCEYNL
jgi:hypothetical protein